MPTGLVTQFITALYLMVFVFCINVTTPAVCALTISFSAQRKTTLLTDKTKGDLTRVKASATAGQK